MIKDIFVIGIWFIGKKTKKSNKQKLRNHLFIANLKYKGAKIIIQSRIQQITLTLCIWHDELGTPWWEYIDIPSEIPLSYKRKNSEPQQKQILLNKNHIDIYANDEP